MSSPSKLKALLDVHSVSVLKKYLDPSRTSECKDFLSSELFLDQWENVYPLFYQQPFPLMEMMVRMQDLHLGEEQIKSVLKEICPNARERVALYVERLKEHPGELGIYKGLLEWDKEESVKIDYVKEFGRLFDNEEYAPYFLQCIDYRRDVLPPEDALKLCKEISDRNAAFKDLLLGNTTIYSALYRRTVDLLKNKDILGFDGFIDTSVLPLIADDNLAKRDWVNLKAVLSLTVSDKTWRYAYFELAIDIKSAGYLRLMAPDAFRHLESLDEITRFVNALYDIVGYSDKEILASVKKIGSSLVRSYYIVAIARKKNLPFDRVMELAHEFSIKDLDFFYREFFKKEYRFQKFRNFFKKKG